MTILLDDAPGLRVGDAVYLKERAVGQVTSLQARGRRIAITLVIDCEHRKTVPEGSQFYLWHDPQRPQHKSLRILSPIASTSSPQQSI